MLSEPIFSHPYVLLALSLFMLILEFFLPGGILAAMSAIVYIFAFAQAFNTLDGMPLVLYSLLAIILPIVTVSLTLRKMVKNKEKNTFYLSKDQEGYVGAAFDSSLIGKRGTAATDLGPSGFALIEGKRVQVVSQSGYVEKGMTISVIQGRGAYLVVVESSD